MKRLFLIWTIGLFLGEILWPPAPHAEQKCNGAMLATRDKSTFLVNGDGTVSDNTTGLMWRQCSLGQDWKDGSCIGQATVLSWTEALKAAQLDDFAGYMDWRLPNKNELGSLIEERCVVPAINEAVFPATPTTFFWSSSPYAGVGTGAWSIDFGYGVITPTEKSGKINVRLVRNED